MKHAAGKSVRIPNKMSLNRNFLDFFDSLISVLNVFNKCDFKYLKCDFVVLSVVENLNSVKVTTYKIPKMNIIYAM